MSEKLAGRHDLDITETGHIGEVLVARNDESRLTCYGGFQKFTASHSLLYHTNRFVSLVP